MATKNKEAGTGSKAKGGRRGSRPDGSPITIGGGGGIDDPKGRTLTAKLVSCIFINDTDYPEPAGGSGKKKFQHPGWYIKSLRITANGVTQDLTPSLPPNGGVAGDVQIKIKCSDSGAPLTIIGKDLGAEFNTGKYSRHSNPGEHTDPDTVNYIKKVEASWTGFYYEKKFNKGDECVVVASNV
jgi:hypothetical protein